MAVIGLTSKVEVNSGGGFATVAELATITIPMAEVAVVEATHLTVSSSCRLFIPGLTDVGVLSFEGIFSKSTYQQLHAVRGITYPWKITTMSDGTATTVFTFNGFLTKTEVSLDNNNAVMVKAEVKVTGPVTVA